MIEMELTLGRIHEAAIALARIMSSPRHLPHTAKFKLAKLHEIVFPIAERVEKRRYELVHELGEEKKNEQGVSQGWALKDEHKDEYDRRWKEICDETMTVEVRPIKLSVLGDAAENGLEVGEFRMLGPLIEE